MSNDEYIIGIKQDQKWLSIDEILKVIVGGAEYSKLNGELSNGKVVLGVVYLKDNGEINSAWSQRIDANFNIEGAKGILGIFIIKAEGLSAVSPNGKVTVKLSEGYLEFSGVEGMKEDARFQVSKAQFRDIGRYGPTLEITMPSGDQILFRIKWGW
ncbi:MAG: hypothetical protein ACPL4E_04715 [Thermoproteota archaeon]